MPSAPAAGTAGTSSPVGGGGPLSEGSLNLSPQGTGGSGAFGLPAATPSGGQNQALLVSSAAARAATAANVTKLQTITQPPAAASIPSVPVNPTPQQLANRVSATATATPAVDNNYFIKQGESVDQYNSRVAAYNASKAPTSPTDTSGSGTSSTAPGSGTATSPSQDTPSVTDPFAGVPGTTPQADINSAVSQLDPSVQGLYRDQLTNQNQTIADAYNATQTAKSNLANDPGLTAALSGIDAQFQVLIDQMNAKNNQVMGRVNSSMSAFGGGGQMAQNYIANETSQATQRVADITAKMKQAEMAATTAYYTKDNAALNTAMNDYTKAKADTATAIKDLMTQVQSNIKDNQAQQRIDAQATKDQQTQDRANAISYANGIAQNAVAAGYSLSDPTKLQDYIASQSGNYNVSDPNILYAAVAKEMQTIQKSALATQNIQDQMNVRDKNATTAENRLAFAEEKAAAAAADPKQSAAEKKMETIANLQDNIDSNSLVPGQTGVFATDSDGKMTPAAWTYMVKNRPAHVTVNDLLDNFGKYLVANDGSTVSTNFGLTAAQQARAVKSVPVK